MAARQGHLLLPHPRSPAPRGAVRPANHGGGVVWGGLWGSAGGVGVRACASSPCGAAAAPRGGRSPLSASPLPPHAPRHPAFPLHPARAPSRHVFLLLQRDFPLTHPPSACQVACPPCAHLCMFALRSRKGQALPTNFEGRSQLFPCWSRRL